MVRRKEADPNCIVESPYYPNELNYADVNDLCENGVIRTVLEQK